MKKIIFALVVPVMMLAAGCNQTKEEIAMLKATNDSLVSVSAAKDSTVAMFVSSFNDIQANLDSIKMKEKIISKASQGNSELKSRTKDQINSDINMIYKLQLDNRRMIASLRSKLKNAGSQAAEMERMIDNLSRQIEEKDVQIAQLKDDLTKVNIQVADLSTKVVYLNANVDTLNTLNQQKQQVIKEKTAELNTAYYVIGTTKDLTEKKIVTKEGGFIGLGRTKELTPEIDKNSLTKVDITNLEVIPIMKNKVAVLTSHPKNSYRLTGKTQADSLVITNQKEFWSLSKVLVLNVK
jgi:predicted  nucleic acid-binding Zn-ribbon protein